MTFIELALGAGSTPADAKEIEERRRERLRDALDKAQGSTEERAVHKGKRPWDSRDKDAIGEGAFRRSRMPGAE